MFRTVLTLCEERLGASGVEAMLGELPGELSEALRYGRVVPSGWYPVPWFRALLGSAAKASGLHTPFVRDLGRRGLKLEYNSVYRALMRVLSTETLLATGLSHFSQVYSIGRVDALEFRDGFAHMYWYDCIGFDRNMWEYLVGACVGLIELTGGRSIEARIVRGGERDDCEATARWL
jgi:hypothetical protein